MQVGKGPQFPFAGLVPELQAGGLASCAVAGTSKDFASYHAFKLTDSQHREHQWTSGHCHFSAVDETGTEWSFILLELRLYSDQRHALEAVGYAWDQDHVRVQLANQSSLIQLSNVTRLLADDIGLRNEEMLEQWCYDHDRKEIARCLFRDLQPMHTSVYRGEQYRFQCEIATLVAKRYRMRTARLVAALDETRKRQT